jgi:hypothetical protein
MECPGAIYHVLNPGDRWEDIFKDDLGRKGFLSALEEACQKTEWQMHAWCLLGHRVDRLLGEKGIGRDSAAGRRESREANAGRSVRKELRRGGWREEDLPGMLKGDKFKVRLSRRLRGETAMSLKWIARRPHTGSWTCVSNLLHEKRKH